jgi:hypothetical protein
VGKPEGKRPLAIPRRKWEDIIKTDLREIGWVVWTGFIWLGIGISGSYCGHGNEPSNSMKYWEILK